MFTGLLPGRLWSAPILPYHLVCSHLVARVAARPQESMHAVCWQCRPAWHHGCESHEAALHRAWLRTLKQAIIDHQSNGHCFTEAAVRFPAVIRMHNCTQHSQHRCSVTHPSPLATAAPCPSNVARTSCTVQLPLQQLLHLHCPAVACTQPPPLAATTACCLQALRALLLLPEGCLIRCSRSSSPGCWCCGCCFTLSC